MLSTDYTEALLTEKKIFFAINYFIDIIANLFLSLVSIRSTKETPLVLFVNSYYLTLKL